MQRASISAPSFSESDRNKWRPERTYPYLFEKVEKSVPFPSMMTKTASTTSSSEPRRLDLTSNLPPSSSYQLIPVTQCDLPVRATNLNVSSATQYDISIPAPTSPHLPRILSELPVFDRIIGELDGPDREKWRRDTPIIDSSTSTFTQMERMNLTRRQSGSSETEPPPKRLQQAINNDFQRKDARTGTSKAETQPVWATPLSPYSFSGQEIPILFSSDFSQRHQASY